jgi:hypothetical protein
MLRVQCGKSLSFLGAFENFRKTSLLRHVRMQQLCSYWADFRDFFYQGLSLKFVKKIQVWLKSDKNVWHFT